ncbi:hypothetical protein C8Q76DRAFT_690248 [Earliella scabrosa]|nr:hypothetical protein C8Q76DRAFT_690248 [Earliella scabrosa]
MAHRPGFTDTDEFVQVLLARRQGIERPAHRGDSVLVQVGLFTRKTTIRNPTGMGDVYCLFISIRGRPSTTGTSTLKLDEYYDGPDSSRPVPTWISHVPYRAVASIKCGTPGESSISIQSLVAQTLPPGVAYCVLSLTSWTSLLATLMRTPLEGARSDGRIVGGRSVGRMPLSCKRPGGILSSN